MDALVGPREEREESSTGVITGTFVRNRKAGRARVELIAESTGDLRSHLLQPPGGTLPSAAFHPATLNTLNGTVRPSNPGPTPSFGPDDACPAPGGGRRSTCCERVKDMPSGHVIRPHLLGVFLSALMLLQILSSPVEASSAFPDEGSALNSILQYLDSAGYDLSNTVVVLKHDPSRPIAWSNHIGPFAAISLNVGSIQQFLDLINALDGLGLTLDSPGPMGFMLFVMAHEFAHINCCQEPTPSVVEAICDELLAHINGTNAACDMVAELRAAAGQPLSEFMSMLLHTLCSFINSDRGKFNNDPDVKAAVANCAGKEDSGEYSPCRCSATSWDPPKADPCSSCPGFPEPGSDPDNPYPNGVIPECDICNHI